MRCCGRTIEIARNPELTEVDMSLAPLSCAAIQSQAWGVNKSNKSDSDSESDSAISQKKIPQSGHQALLRDRLGE